MMDQSKASSIYQKNLAKNQIEAMFHSKSAATDGRFFFSLCVQG
ncbi:MAG TPA: hypothetical protein VFN25_04145 [Dokdonella sp.]|nr:hypothetical protein [Dokdonella sp.]HET9032080.1 hypothetical protein [Dokdonella sp.]